MYQHHSTPLRGVGCVSVHGFSRARRHTLVELRRHRTDMTLPSHTISPYSWAENKISVEGKGTCVCGTLLLLWSKFQSSDKNGLYIRTWGGGGVSEGCA